MPHRGFVRSLRAQWLGDRLRALRVEREMTLAEVATHLGRDLSALGRYEKAQWPIKLGDVVALLDLYGIHNTEQRERLLSIASRVWHLHHWDGDPVTASEAWFITPQWLAGRATAVLVYHPNLVPEPMRSLTYGARLNRTRTPWLAHSHSGMGVRALLEQAVLRQELEQPGLCHDQLTHLAALSQQPFVSVRVLAEDLRRLPVLPEPVAVFLMREPYPAVAMTEGLAGRHYLEGPLAQQYTDTYQRLWDSALPETESASVINKLRENASRP
ncbi:Scr1 family TA system antitoxin-like transcriptional regulator [Actinomycetes bacterium KLBMP 9797]